MQIHGGINEWPSVEKTCPSVFSEHGMMVQKLRLKKAIACEGLCVSG